MYQRVYHSRRVLPSLRRCPAPARKNKRSRRRPADRGEGEKVRGGEGGDQHLVPRPDASQDQRQVQRGRAGAERQRVGRAHGRGEPCPELRPERCRRASRRIGLERVHSPGGDSRCRPSGAIQLDAKVSWTNGCSRPDTGGGEQVQTGHSVWPL